MKAQRGPYADHLCSESARANGRITRVNTANDRTLSARRVTGGIRLFTGTLLFLLWRMLILPLYQESGKRGPQMQSVTNGKFKISSSNISITATPRMRL
uniref:Uncharacterized protein n=1 Tax=Anguilla anguilla TaxID=7936 RepID=A0A0E9XGR6_ANGAN